jgi:uncharacterized protein
MDAPVEIEIEVEPGHGGMIKVPAGHLVTVTDVDGGQVGDLFAFAARDPSEYLSASHTRAALMRTFPREGEAFYSNRREPLLLLEEDASPGVHDMLVAACDAKRYLMLGASVHRSCASNLVEAYPLAQQVPTPQPVNIFMKVDQGADGSLALGMSPSEPGDSITLRAVRDCVIVVSACPQDLIPISRGGLSALRLTVSPV